MSETAGAGAGAVHTQVHYVKGDDPALVAQAVHALVARLVGGEDPSLVVEEHGLGDTLDVGRIVDALSTAPFLVERRVVVVRDAGRLGAGDAARIAEVLGHLAPSVHLVLAAGGGAVPQLLARAAGADGDVVDAAAGRGRERTRWLAGQLEHAEVRLDAAAAHRIEEHLGEDLGRLEGLLDALAAAYGPRASLHAADIEQFLGEAGAVPPWELTDAIDNGDVAGALRALQRMLVAGGRPAPVVLAILHGHLSNVLRLDGADAVSADDAAAILGVRSSFVAKKALDRARQLGSEGAAHAVSLLADADLDLKGRSALGQEVVLEILVARLARLGRTRAPARRAKPGASRGGRRRP